MICGYKSILSYKLSTIKQIMLTYIYFFDILSKIFYLNKGGI